MAELGRSLKALLLFEQTSSIAPLSYATPEQAQEWIDYTRTQSSHIAQYGTAEVLVSGKQQAVELVFALVRWVYRLAIWPALALGFWQTARGFKALARALRRKEFSAQDALLPFLLLGLLLSALLRAGMIAYIETTSFRIGTYLLYLAPAGLALLLFAAMGAGLWLDRLRPSDMPLDEGREQNR